MQKQGTETAEYITLTEVANIAPGRPSTNCIWRWCRKGVLSRSGDRIRLQHVRIGGMIYSKSDWLEEFGSRLAEEDAKYFDLCNAASAANSKHSRRERTVSRTHEDRRKAIEDAERDLADSGI